ncbi:helix-turn-helix transcriptional regulator [Shimazuella sp. AN120528]|uniref:helix-turn-helix transcriptional regulator n=1 Tax=Shimazuella soli TaxID=1892854 RepID=UPI001F0E0284|nr:helix-turn-helix transcriptional regulator [Shimazuella soli]MCH5585585.1 helix-turn-helix transcriptional regulator [Shimazuella soli]
MNEDTRLKALSEFLKTHRAKLQPHEVGLPSIGRRRTPGLRREEVAQLAGISTTWYTWFEQGRNITLTSSVLNSISSALQLNEEEKKYLFMLALDQPTLPNSEKAPEISSGMKAILHELRHFPTIVSDSRCNIIEWNQAAAGVFLNFDQIPQEERNMIWLLFTRRELRQLAVNWPDFVRGFLALFRSYYGKYMGDPWYNEFISKLSAKNADFQSFWHQNDVSSSPEVFIEFRHAKMGKMLFDLTSLDIKENSDIRCSVFTPSDKNTEIKMKQIVQRVIGE